MNEITQTRPGEENALTVAEPQSLLNFVARALVDPAIDVTKLEMLLRMQREIVAEEARLQFSVSMNLAQGEIQAVARNAVNSETRSKYATLEAVDAAIRPVTAKHGFSLMFSQADNEGPEIRIECVVRHREGHAETFHLSALSDMTGPKGTPNKTQVQGVGSSVSYLRRYLTCMIFNVALRDDNDGNRAKQKVSEETGELAGSAQTELLYRLLADCSADPKAIDANERTFLSRMGMGDFRTLKDVPVGHFVRLKNALLTKKNIMAQRAARANAQTQTGDVR